MHNTRFHTLNTNQAGEAGMKKIQPGYLAQQAADRIRDMIRNGSLKLGGRILEEPMCAAMGVSAPRCAKLCASSAPKD
jgi:DNA-binding GntR family transcriptional regulator